MKEVVIVGICDWMRDYHVDLLLLLVKISHTWHEEWSFLRWNILLMKLVYVRSVYYDLEERS